MVAGHDSVGYAVIALFGLFFLFELAIVVHPAQLTLTDQDFRVDWLTRHSTYQFKHCSEFQVAYINYGYGRTKVISFQYDGPSTTSFLGRRSGANAGRRVSVPSNFRMRANELVELLNARRTTAQSLGPT
jgi:hypothetical protein